METKVLGGFLEASVMGFDFYQMSPKDYFACFMHLLPTHSSFFWERGGCIH